MRTHSLPRFPVLELFRRRPGWWFATLTSLNGVLGGRLALALLDLAGQLPGLAACFKLPVVGVDHLLNRFHHLRPDALDLFQFFGRHGTKFFHRGYARLDQLLGQLFTQAVIDEYRDWRSR